MKTITDTRVEMFGGPSVAPGTLGHTGTPPPARGGTVDVFDMPPACMQAP
jgi:hypothetical protein